MKKIEQAAESLYEFINKKFYIASISYEKNLLLIIAGDKVINDKVKYNWFPEEWQGYKVELRKLKLK